MKARLSSPGPVVKMAALLAIARSRPGFRDLKRRTLDTGFLRELQQRHPGGDLCGENGDYHIYPSL
jgi:hypothetical protein